MTPPNPLKRVTLSRQTLYKYRTLPGGTNDRPDELLAMIRQEIEILQRIATERGGSESIVRLIDDWREFAETQKVRAH